MDNVLFILVLYKMRAEESPAWQALRQFCSDKEMETSVFIHDNTIHNIYLAEPYNLGVQKAKEQNKQFIVLLDQDTFLTQEYLKKVKEISQQHPKIAKVYVPLLKDANGNIFSPWHTSQLSGFARNKSYKQNFFLSSKQFLTACNSCTIIDIRVFEKIGRFDTRFQLDSLDHWFFYMCYRYKIPVEIIQLEILHSLSVSSGGWNNVSVERYYFYLNSRKILAEEMGFFAVLFYKKTLIEQCIKWIFIRKRMDCARLALRFLFNKPC